VKYTAFGSVKEGKLKIRARPAFDKYIKSMDGKELEITVQKKRNKRTNHQNRYYWSGVLQCAKQGFFDAGHSLTKEEIHEEFKRRFLEGKEIINKDTGEAIRIPGTTTDLTRSDFSDYIAEIKGFCMEWLNCSIPDPDEQLTITE